MQDIITGIFILFFALGIYLIPTWTAIERKHHNKGAIIVINIFLGWTFVGWVIALAMAYSKVDKN